MARCLVVDDDFTVRAYLLDALIDLGHTGEAVDCGEKALQILSEDTKYDLVFLDFHMPGASGLDVAKQLRSRWPKLKVVFLTADLDPETFDRVEAQAPGVAGFLHKPFTYDTLEICLDVVIKKGGRFTHKKQPGMERDM